MRTMIIEGGRAAPQGRQKAVAVVVVFVLPGPVDSSGQRRTPNFYVAVGADPANHTQVWMGIPGGIMTVTSHCPRTAVEALMINLRAMGWEPRPGEGGKLPVQQAIGRPYAPQDVPGQLFLQYLLDLQSGMMRPEELPSWLGVTGRSGKVFRPCGGVVGPRGPAIGSPCPEGPCQLNNGASCVWKTHSGRERPAQAVPPNSGWRQQATLASQHGAPTNGVSAGGYASPSGALPSPAPGYSAPRAPEPVVPDQIHAPGGEFVMDMTPDHPTVGEFATQEPDAPAPAPKRKVTRRKPATKKKTTTKKTSSKRTASKG